VSQPNSPNIVSTPAQSYQPYDADGDGGTAPWVKLEENGGPADIHTGRVSGEFADSAPWVQV
jgi:hypothetical protein